MLSKNNIIFITGTAGFIGFHLAKSLLEKKHTVIGMDGMTDYYDVNLKKKRHQILNKYKKFFMYEGMLEDRLFIESLFEKHKPKILIHLAAQAGVRYSIENPRSYFDANITGTFNILECAKVFKIKHLLIASTSSVYGSNISQPFDELQKCDNQISFYAATKKAIENFSHSYSHIYKIPTTLFRFFTVYGPWGRPDMALFKFTKAILSDQPIDVFNHGKMSRDFTYINDLVNAINLLIDAVPKPPSKRENLIKFDSISNVAAWRVVNIGNSESINLMDYIRAIETVTGKKAKMNFLEMQVGDVPSTLSSNKLLKALTGYKPKTSINEGVENFIKWYKDHYLRS